MRVTVMVQKAQMPIVRLFLFGILASIPVNALVPTQAIHLFIDPDLLRDATLQQWGSEATEIVRSAETRLCMEMKSANKGATCLDFNNVMVSEFDPGLQAQIRQAARAGTPKGTVEKPAVDLLWRQSDQSERRIYLVRALRYCGGAGDRAGCSLLGGRVTIIGLGGIFRGSPSQPKDVVDEHGITLLHELGHQCDLYDLEDPTYLMYIGAPLPRRATRLGRYESAFFDRLLPQ